MSTATKDKGRGSLDGQNGPSIERWLTIGQANPWISQAFDPDFTTASFRECHSIAELQHELTRCRWCVGQAFYLDDLCLIQQVEGGDEWLTIRHGFAFESITFGPSIARSEFGELIARLLAASPDECRALTW